MAMIITVGEREFELKTKLGTAAALELKTKRPLASILGALGDATVTELIDMLLAAAGKEVGTELRELLSEHWDFIDLQTAVQELLVRLMFSGSPEDIERKMSKFPDMDEAQKNTFRQMLGLPMTGIPKTPEN